jgi:hypothetical protein
VGLQLRGPDQQQSILANYRFVSSAFRCEAPAVPFNDAEHTSTAMQRQAGHSGGYASTQPGPSC